MAHRHRVKGWKDVRRCCKENDIDYRDCNTGHVMIGPFPDGHYETVTRSREYGKATICRLTKLFATFGFLALMFYLFAGIIV